MSEGLNFESNAADKTHMKQTRRDDRNLCADLLKVRWKEGPRDKHETFASLEDISHAGACLQVDDAIPVDATLTIYYPGGRYKGKVKYCIFEGADYFVGIEFDAGYRWSQRKYNPAHLLQFRLRKSIS